VDVRLQRVAKFGVECEDTEYEKHYVLPNLIDSIFYLGRSEVWRNYIHDSITNITIKYHESLSWTIEVKKIAKEDCMLWDTAAPQESSWKKCRAANTMSKIRIGLGGIMKPNVVVASD
jgi:hypothetical protein